MTLKIALLALALVAAWLVLFRPRRPAPRAGRKAARPVTALEACPRCGVFRLPGGRCECAAPPGHGD